MDLIQMMIQMIPNPKEKMLMDLTQMIPIQMMPQIKIIMEKEKERTVKEKEKERMQMDLIQMMIQMILIQKERMQMDLIQMMILMILIQMEKVMERMQKEKEKERMVKV